MASSTTLPARATDRWLEAQLQREIGVASTDSARIAASSLRKRSADWMAKPVATSAMTRNDVAKYESVRFAPPTLAIMWASALLLATKLSIVGAIQPYAMPATRTPTPQPISVPRWRRTASPTGRPRLAVAPV